MSYNATYGSSSNTSLFDVVSGTQDEATTPSTYGQVFSEGFDGGCSSYHTCYNSCSCKEANGWFASPAGAKAYAHSHSTELDENGTMVALRSKRKYAMYTNFAGSMVPANIGSTDNTVNGRQTCYHAPAKPQCPEGYFTEEPDPIERYLINIDETSSSDGAVTCYKPTSCRSEHDAVKMQNNVAYDFDASYQGFSCGVKMPNELYFDYNFDGVNGYSKNIVYRRDGVVVNGKYKIMSITSPYSGNYGDSVEFTDAISVNVSCNDSDSMFRTDDITSIDNWEFGNSLNPHPYCASNPNEWALLTSNGAYYSLEGSNPGWNHIFEVTMSLIDDDGSVVSETSHGQIKFIYKSGASCPEGYFTEENSDMNCTSFTVNGVKCWQCEPWQYFVHYGIKITGSYDDLANPTKYTLKYKFIREASGDSPARPHEIDAMGAYGQFALVGMDYQQPLSDYGIDVGTSVNDYDKWFDYNTHAYKDILIEKTSSNNMIDFSEFQTDTSEHLIKVIDLATECPSAVGKTGVERNLEYDFCTKIATINYGILFVKKDNLGQSGCMKGSNHNCTNFKRSSNPFYVDTSDETTVTSYYYDGIQYEIPDLCTDNGCMDDPIDYYIYFKVGVDTSALPTGTIDNVQFNCPGRGMTGPDGHHNDDYAPTNINVSSVNFTTSTKTLSTQMGKYANGSQTTPPINVFCGAPTDYTHVGIIQGGTGSQYNIWNDCINNGNWGACRAVATINIDDIKNLHDGDTFVYQNKLFKLHIVNMSEKPNDDYFCINFDYVCDNGSCTNSQIATIANDIGISDSSMMVSGKTVNGQTISLKRYCYARPEGNDSFDIELEAKEKRYNYSSGFGYAYILPGFYFTVAKMSEVRDELTEVFEDLYDDTTIVENTADNDLLLVINEPITVGFTKIDGLNSRAGIPADYKYFGLNQGTLVNLEKNNEVTFRIEASSKRKIYFKAKCYHAPTKHDQVVSSMTTEEKEMQHFNGEAFYQDCIHSAKVGNENLSQIHSFNVNLDVPSDIRAIDPDFFNIAEDEFIMYAEVPQSAGNLTIKPRILRTKYSDYYKTHTFGGYIPIKARWPGITYVDGSITKETLTRGALQYTYRKISDNAALVTYEQNTPYGVVHLVKNYFVPYAELYVQNNYPKVKFELYGPSTGGGRIPIEADEDIEIGGNFHSKNNSNYEENAMINPVTLSQGTSSVETTVGSNYSQSWSDRYAIMNYYSLPGNYRLFEINNNNSMVSIDELYLSENYWLFILNKYYPL